jgi:hypothetical protein
MSMNGHKLFALAGIILLFVGCGVSVKYAKPQEDEDGRIKFRLIGSILTLTAKPPSNPAKQEKKPVDTPPESEPPVDLLKRMVFDCPESDKSSKSALECVGDVTPVATPTNGSEKIAIVVHDWPWRQTMFSATFLDRQPELLKELGAEVTDYGVEIIGAAAAIAKTAIGIGLRVLSDQQSSGVSRIAATKLFKDFHEGGFWSTGSFPVSACQGADLVLMFLPGASEEKAKEAGKNPPKRSTVTINNLRVADPHYVETYAIPDKGSIKFKAICGADVDAKPSGVASGWKILQTLADQAQAVYDAQKKDDTKDGKKGTK